MNPSPRRSLRHPRRVIALGIALALSTALAACKHTVFQDFNPPLVCDTKAVVESSVFFIGDAGAPKLPDPESATPDALVDPVLLALRRDVDAQVSQVGAERTAVIFLGDNIYPAGLELPGEDDHEHGKRVLDAQVASVGDAQGFFTLGNHDWDQGKPGRGWQVANAQTQYLSSRAPNISIHPGGTCAGPEVVDFGDQIRFLFIDLWAAIYQIDANDQHQAGCAYRAGEGAILNRIVEIFEESKETYYETLEASSTGWHDGKYDVSPWMDYFWGVLLCAYREFEDRVGTIGLGKGSKTEQVRQIVDRRLGPFSISDIEADCIGVSRDMIRIVLRQLRDDGVITLQGKGRGAKWIRRQD